MHKIIALLACCLLLFSCKGDKVKDKQNGKKTYQVGDVNRNANEFFDRKFDEAVARSPIEMSYLGIKDPEAYRKWDDMSEIAEKEDLDFYKGLLKQLKDSVDINQLDKQTKLSYQLFEMYCQSEIDDYKWRNFSYPVNQMFGVHSSMPAFLINIHQINSVDDAKAYLDRLEGINWRCNQLIAKLKRHESNGVVPPKFVFDHVLNDCKNVIDGRPFTRAGESALYKDFKKKVEKLKLEEQEEKRLIQGAEKRLVTLVKPGYEKLIKFLKGQQKRATTDDGAWKFEKGAAYYNYRLKKITTTDMTSDEIHQLGLDEVKRIHGEIADIMEKVEFKGDQAEFFEFMRNDQQFFYENNDAGKKGYMRDAEAIIDAMRPKLDELFITKPKAALVVKAVEPFREKSAGKAFYQSPAPDGSRPGTYYANTYDMNSMPNYQMEALAYHEAIPGHHMQLSIAQELGTMPKFRKFKSDFTAYVEGWGLYSEYLPKEIGFYKDHYSNFGRLAMELWRACRLVVDTGIHGKKWTRQEGIDYYKNNTPNPVADCVKMVDRHIVMPGQATAYKIGMIKILELRENAKKALGDKFDIKGFHEVVLTNGALPLDILEDLVQEWVDSVK